MKRTFIFSGFIGITVVVMSFVLLSIFPSKAPGMTKGFFTPIIAYEFISTPQEVYLLFGQMNSPEQKTMISAMDLGNRIDFLFMILYSSFLFTFSLICRKETGSKIFYACAAISILVMFGDLLENLQLLSITSKIGAGDFTAELYYLKIFTWLKWGGICILFALFFTYFSRGNLYSRVVGYAGIITPILGVLAFLHRS